MSLHDLIRIFPLPVSSGDASADLLSYLAWSDTSGFDADLCYRGMLERRELVACPGLGYGPQEASVFKKRFEVMRTSNHLYRLAVIQHPTVADLEEFSYIDPCFSLLWPLKSFLFDHPSMARSYRGCVPFGRPVQEYFSAYSDYGVIKGTPDYKAHMALRGWTIALADFYGVSTLAINTEMYVHGMKMIGKTTAAVQDEDL